MLLITLRNGRTVNAGMPEPNGSTRTEMLDGGTMSLPEWSEFCARLATKLGPGFRRVTPC